MNFTIRPATLADLPAVTAIANHYVATSTCTFQLDPDTEADRLAWFENRGPAHPVTVAESAGGVVGWAALSPWHARAGYAGTAEASVYVRPNWHRRGVGRSLVLDLLDRARAAGLHTVVGRTCTEQSASVALQESLGFTPAGVLREAGYKFGRWLDVLTMQLILTPAEDRS